MWFEKGCVVVGGVQDSIEISMILKGRRRMVQPDERVVSLRAMTIRNRCQTATSVFARLETVSLLSPIDRTTCPPLIICMPTITYSRWHMSKLLCISRTC